MVPGQTVVSGQTGGTRGDGTVRTILLSAGVSLLLSLFGTPLAIRIFSRRGYGQLIREEGPAGHATKRGTPTMGGTVIVIAAVVGYFVGNIFTGQEPSVSGVLVMFLMVGLGVVGFLDDFIKIYKQRSLGLRSGAKLAGQAVVGAVFALLVVQQHFADGYDLTPADAHLSFLRDFGPSIGVTAFMLWIVFLIAGTSNAVNLTDGLDGLATGCACLVLAAYVLIGNWQLRNDCTPSSPRTATTCATRWTWRWWRRRCSAPASGSCGGTRRRPGSSWATPGRWPWAGCWPGWPCAPRPSCCWPSWAACSWSSPCP